MNKLEGLTSRYRKSWKCAARERHISLPETQVAALAHSAALGLLERFELQRKLGKLIEFNADFVVYRQGCLARGEKGQRYERWVYSRQLVAIDALAREEALVSR